MKVGRSEELFVEVGRRVIPGRATVWSDGTLEVRVGEQEFGSLIHLQLDKASAARLGGLLRPEILAELESDIDQWKAKEAALRDPAKREIE